MEPDLGLKLRKHLKVAKVRSSLRCSLCCESDESEATVYCSLPRAAKVTYLQHTRIGHRATVRGRHQTSVALRAPTGTLRSLTGGGATEALPYNFTQYNSETVMICEISSCQLVAWTCESVRKLSGCLSP